MNAMQCRMGRSALNWTVRDLASKAEVGVNTVTRFETGADTLASTVTKIRAALETAGVEFIAENGGGAGVRLRKGS
jgi:hypothetical protein